MSIHNIRLMNYSSYSVSLVVPAYNEASRIPKMLHEHIDFFETRKVSDPSFTYEIIVVSDGSSDKTCEVAIEIGREKKAPLKVIECMPNRGKGSAVKIGMLYSQGDILLFADADNATEISGYDRAEDELRSISHKNKAVVVGNRNHNEKDLTIEVSSIQREGNRGILNKGFLFGVNLLCRTNLSDTQCGFKLFTREAAQNIFMSQHLERFAFDVELLFVARQCGIPIAESPVAWHEIPNGSMNLFRDSILMARDILAVRILYLLRIWKPEDICI